MKRVILVLFLVAMMALVTPFAVGATLANPDSISVESAMAFTDLAEAGDMTVIFHYDISYNGTYPTTSAADTIDCVLYDGASGLELSHPYKYFIFDNNGYGDGVGAFYFDAASAPVWGGAYTITIHPSETYFTGAFDADYVLQSSEYTTAEGQASNRAAFHQYIIDIVDSLESTYGVSLKLSNDGLGTEIFNQLGVSYFSGAIPGVQILCPDLFAVQITVPTALPTTTANMTMRDQYTQRLQDTDVMRGFNRLGDLMGGMPGTFMAALLSFVLSVVICVVTFRMGWGLEPGMIFGGIVLLLGALLVGDVIFTLTMIGGLVAGIALIWIMVGKRA